MAKRICDALRAAGIEVWFDQSELRGGDAWDSMIRKRIKECALFMPVITPTTNARAEGYFRLEWKLAVDRSHLMAEDAPFLFPIVVGDVSDASARVPDKFRDVQWTRLRLDETPAELGVRVAKLLEGGSMVGGVLHPDSSEPSGRKVPPTGKAARWQWWMIFPVIGTIMGLLFAAIPFWKSLNRPARQGPPATGPIANLKSEISNPAPRVPASEARQLAEKARAIFDKIDSNADDYAVAESLLKRALELDATDGVIWAYSARLNAAYLTRSFERGTARAEVARNHAERAVKLAPESAEAWHALGRAIWRSDPPRAEEALRHALQLAPDDGHILISLGSICRNAGRDEDALAYYVRASAQPDVKPLALYDQFLIHLYLRRFAEADRCGREAMAVLPTTNSVTGIAMLEIVWHGRVDAAQRILADAPTAMRAEPRMVFATALAALMAKQADVALAALDRMPGDFINDAWYSGPKALFVGLAHQQAGRAEAARIAWETGLTIVRRRLQDTPNDAEQHLRLGELLAYTGQTEAALREAHAFEELARGRTDWTYSSARIYAALGRADEAMPILEKFLTATATGRWPLTPALLRLDPLWDKLRDDPRFQKLATSESPAASDWPHDAELKRAITLIDSLDATLEDFRLADEISTRAAEKAPSDPEAVTVRARVHSAFITRNFDFSAERTAAAKRFGERAVQLSPDDPQALYALSVFLYERNGDLARAESLARRATELAPDDARFARQLFRERVYEHPENAVALGEELIKRFPRDVLSHYELSIAYRNAHDWEKFERETDGTIALFPLANAINWKARAVGVLHGDFGGMRGWLDRVPERMRTEERTVISAVICATLGGDYGYGLNSLQAFAEPWFYDVANYAGPAALPAAMLLTQQGKTGLAREQYEQALRDIAQRRKSNPSDQTFRRAEIWTLLGLGRLDEARALYRTQLESITHPYRVFSMTGWWFDSIPQGLLLGERETALTLIREAAALPEGRKTIQQRMQVDARMAPFRGDPEITAALAGSPQAAVAPAKSAAPDWPKDPELKRAMKLMDSPEAIASDVVLAEDIVKTVLAARPTDVEATLAMGRVQVYTLVRGFDRSEDRFATARHFAERAMALSPDDPEAMSVMATYLYRRGVELPRAAKLLRAAIAARPTNPIYYRMLDNVLSITPDITDAEVIASAKVTAERFPQDALVQYELARHYRDAGMLAEAEHYLDVAIQLGPVANAIIARARLMLTAHGNPAGMKALLDQLPERYRGTDRAVYSQLIYAMAMQQPRIGLDALQALPEPWMIDFDYTGPVSLLAGELLLQEGKPELAKLRFTEALAELGRHKADLSRNFSTTWLETWLLMRLGRLDEARQRNEVFFPEMTRPFRLYLGTNWWFNPITLNLLLGDRAKALPLMREVVGFQQGRTVLRNVFLFDPRMAPFRDDPEIKAILAEPAEKKP